MSTASTSALDNLTRIVQVVGHDEKLRRWFHSLSQMSAVERQNAIYLMSERMVAQCEDADFVASFRLLADVRVFDAARLALRE